jgi:hypothetical protein
VLKPMPVKSGRRLVSRPKGGCKRRGPSTAREGRHHGPQSPYIIPLYALRWPIQFESKRTAQTNDADRAGRPLVAVGAGVVDQHGTAVLIQPTAFS